MKKFLFIYLFLGSVLLHAQDLSLWSENQLAKANTASGLNYLNEEEKAIIFIANLVRIDGQLFAETILTEYLKDSKPNKYTRSLYKDLKSIQDLPVFYPEKDLYNIAEEHAEVSGKKGTTGHQRFEKRFGPLMGKYREVAENCAYGYDKAIDILIQLLIDEDIPDLGHRKNLLNPNLDSIGVSIKPHKKFRTNCVMDFGDLVERRN